MAKAKKTKKVVKAVVKAEKTKYVAGQYVYAFKDAYGLGKPLLGGKGAGLAEMTHIGIRIPDGFTITTEACTLYYDSGRKIPADLVKQIKDGVKELEKRTGKTFGKGPNPLLVSVRSGARVSMPGMMDTILNLGLNDDTVKALAIRSGKERFAYDCYRRFILMFTNIAMGLSRDEMDGMLDDVKKRLNLKNDYEVPVDELKKLIEKYKVYYKGKFGVDFPTDPQVQLMTAVKAIFHSWDNERANLYRKMNNIPYSWGTAVNVQMMAFGNMNDQSGTGVGFTRHPTDGVKEIFAEYLINAQGEDVVAGIRTPLHIDALKKQQPKIYQQLVDSAEKLENHYKDVQDFEFTVEDGILYFLQTRNGKRTGVAGLKIATDMVKEGLINEQEALLRVDPRSLDQLLHPTFVESERKKAVVIGHGNPASPGAAVGGIVFNAEDAQAKRAANKDVKLILVRAETSPEDLGGMVSADGILTARGGMTSHAAVVARQIGKCCITGCGEAVINEKAKTMTLGGKTFKEGDVLSINGSTGEVYLGEVKTEAAGVNGNFATVLKWADKYAKMRVYANADTPEEAQKAVEFGARGIGLCRTEHMFRQAGRLFLMQEMILSSTTEERESWLAKLEPYQEDDFYKMYLALGGVNINVRLLDPPLDEYLPKTEEDIAAVAKSTGKSVEAVKARVNELHMTNPMMGLRGCRLDVVYPEIGRMQATAIIKAALHAEEDLSKKKGKKVTITASIMVPQVVAEKEFKFVKDLVSEVADKIIAASKFDKKMKYIVGTMIETPRATITAGEIAKDAAYFSYGTNDLTQFTFGFSRNDYSSYVGKYLDNNLIDFDPFKTLDNVGVGRLIALSVKEGKAANPTLHCGICGETGGDPESIAYFNQYGCDYVSCSPFRVPGARLAAAQAQIRAEGKYKY
ncbi:MAG: pyruvate, phosphate dikinase [Bacilli bacterium]|jgi:pyruvate,orthophosphate dikinase|nr:pyruvate, phosphate dikinase [Bacilli bacterium]